MLDTTCIIKTFNRPACLDQLIQSIRLYYPTIKIIIANDGDRLESSYDAVVLDLPFDSGASYGRNRAVEVADTTYVLFLDDDFLFTENTKVEVLVDELKRRDIDILGGWVDPEVYWTGILERVNGKVYCLRQRRQWYDGHTGFDLICQFFLAKTESMLNHKWSDHLKTEEHMDFFWRARGKLKIDMQNAVKIKHVECSNHKYRKYRNRKEFLTGWLKDTGVDELIVQMRGDQVIIQNGRDSYVGARDLSAILNKPKDVFGSRIIVRSKII